MDLFQLITWVTNPIMQSFLWWILLQICNWKTFTPPIDHHVNELWVFQIFLDCFGYQQYFHVKLEVEIYTLYNDKNTHADRDSYMILSHT